MKKAYNSLVYGRGSYAKLSFATFPGTVLMADEDVWDDWEDMADSGVIMHSLPYENNLYVGLG